MEQMKSLEYYIKEIQGCDQIFDHGITHRTPLLCAGIVNRIIFYPGCFNPPHIGHLALLRHVFEHSGRDMNIIAAVIFPLDDESLVGKLGPQNDDIILTKRQRVKLWRGHGLADYFWVYEGSATSWEAFQSQLIQDVSRDGFDLKFSVLFGPDHLQNMDIFPPTPWGYGECLTSDISRDAKLTEITSSGMTSMKRLDLYEPWEKTMIDCESIRKTAVSQVSWMVSGLHMMSPKSTRDMLRRGKVLSSDFNLKRN